MGPLQTGKQEVFKFCETVTYKSKKVVEDVKTGSFKVYETAKSKSTQVREFLGKIYNYAVKTYQLSFDYFKSTPAKIQAFKATVQTTYAAQSKKAQLLLDRCVVAASYYFKKK